MEVLKIENLYAGYNGDNILYDINLNVNKNTIYLVIGPNGSGKSTLLKIIAGMILPKRGKIYYLGEEITYLPVYKRVKLGIKMMPQIRAIYPYMTVKENLEIGGYYLRKEILEKMIEDLIELFPNFKYKLNTKAYNLSGGEQRLLELLMTLIGRPRLALLDEPTAMLSPKYTSMILHKINEIKEIMNIPIILVEQKIFEAMKIADQVCMMDLGRVIYYGEKEDAYIKNALFSLFFG